MFALLLINAGSVVPVHRIVNSIWGSSPPNSVMATLHSYVSRLRKSIGDTTAGRRENLLTVRSVTPGYVLDIAPHQTDVDAFETAVENGRLRLAEGDLAVARDTARAAMDLWTGTPYGELASYEFAAQESERLEQLRLQGVRIWADACLGLGQYDEVIRELDKEVRRNPMLEQLGIRLMLAQYHTGQPAQALLTYERIRSHLATELGADASKELRILHQAVMRQDLTPPHTAPDPMDGPRGRPQPLGSPRPAEQDRGPGPGRAEPPPWATQLVGRESEMAQLGSFVGEGDRMRTLLMIGEQGVGKTRLLKEFEKELTSAGTAVVWAHCTEAPGAPDYQVWHRIVSKLLRTRGRQLDSLSSEVRVNLSVPNQERPMVDSGERTLVEHLGFQDAVCQLLLAAAEEPLALFIEDLHYADIHTLELLHLLAKEVYTAQLVVIGTVREHCVRSRPQLKHAVAALLCADAVESMHLTALSPADTRTLVQWRDEAPVSGDLVLRLHRATGGNPYLLTGLLRSRDVADDQEDLLDSLPFDMQVVLECRLAEPPAEVITILEICAVIGPVIDRRLLASVLVLRGTTGSVNDALQTGLLVSNPADPNDLRFSHGLVRDLLLARVDTRLRAQLRHSVAQALANETAGAPYS
ncbi:BTAD domain-containing putative transcriptional regulator [Streptomyces sp. NPDC001530]|uniref:BTAD domain-containing putative transcriptional regulator n=1 Tax=Streptomyces sp. NPDC001530 TaxID=3364582 RepID=UPI0036893DC2